MSELKPETRLLAGVDAWNTWRRTLHPEIDLRGVNLYGADLRGAELNRADLQEANLVRANLVRANLAEADLRRANLRHADLRGANLSGCNLSGANLHGAELFEADFWGADLRGIDLRGIDFRGTNLAGAFLDGADLTGARLGGAYLSGTILGNVKLQDAIGLDQCEHGGPSIIDVATLQQSGMLPEIFLRGCGLPDDFIQYLPSFLNQPIQFYSCFISYSHDDKAFARLLHDRLQGQGIRCWLDEHQLLPGDDLHDRIDQGIRLWDKVLLCASSASLTSWWVDGEINRAFQKEAQLMKERGKKVLSLVPLNLDGFLFGAAYQSGKKGEITSRVAANFVGWEKDHALFDRELEKVIRALRTDEGGREPPPPAIL